MNNKYICSNGSLRESVAIFIDQNPILTKYKGKKYYELEDALVDFVDKEIAKATKYVYVIKFSWDDGEESETNVLLFNTYAKAISTYEKIIKQEKNPEISWVGEALDEDGYFPTDYDFDEVEPDLEKETIAYWYVYNNGKFDDLTLLKMEVN